MNIAQPIIITYGGSIFYPQPENKEYPYRTYVKEFVSIIDPITYEITRKPTREQHMYLVSDEAGIEFTSTFSNEKPTKKNWIPVEMIIESGSCIKPSLLDL